MSSFYTSVSRYGNNLLYRGYDKGKKVSKRIAFEPTLYVKDSDTKRVGGLRNLNDEPVSPMKFDSMREATEFTKTYKDVGGFTVYGTTNYVDQFVATNFPSNIQFDRDVINVTTIDIEVYSEEGFPSPDQAEWPVTAITIHNNIDDRYYIWATGEYTPTEDDITFFKHKTELEMLLDFLRFWNVPEHTPDVITGWNSKAFDMPYLINRLVNLMGEGSEAFKRFSPWLSVQPREMNSGGSIQSKINVYEIAGIEQLDYLDLFRKFGLSYGEQESYRLDHIAYVVLGDRKLSYEEHGSLANLYLNDHQKYCEYNITDVRLVQRLEKKMGLITLAMTMAYRGGVNYSKVFGTVAIWDAIIHRQCSDRSMVVPPQKNSDRVQYPGAYVKEPMIGMHNWVASFDLASLYPNILIQYNMSPETLYDVLPGVSPKLFLENRLIPKEMQRDDLTLTATGLRFTKDKQGVIPAIVEQYFNERKAIKGKMIKKKQSYEGLKKELTGLSERIGGPSSCGHRRAELLKETQQLENQINALENEQMSIKILMNSLYGSLASPFSRYFDPRMAEAITTSGQLSILYAEKAMNKEMNKILQTDGQDFVIAIDTDSLYINFEQLVAKIDPPDPVDFLDRICGEHFETVLGNDYQHLARVTGSRTNRMEMEREVIADRAIWISKKRYILNVHNNEGVQYDEPKLKIMGIEAIKSSTPEVCRQMFKQAFEIIMKGSEEETQSFLAKWKAEHKLMTPEQISSPRGVSNITKWHDPYTTFTKGTPIHVRGALVYNKSISEEGLGNQYDLIKNGEKIKFVYLKVPNHVRQDVVSFPNVLPKELDLARFIDYNKMYTKTFGNAMDNILNAIGWTSEPKSTLDAFFVDTADRHNDPNVANIG